MDNQKLQELEGFSHYINTKVEDLEKDLKETLEELAQAIQINKVNNESKFSNINENFDVFENLSKVLYADIKELRQARYTLPSSLDNKQNNIPKPTNYSEEISLLMDKYLSKEFEILENEIEQRLKNEIDFKLKNNKSKNGNNSLSWIAIILSICAIILFFLV